MITRYWAFYTDEIDGFVNVSMVCGNGWAINLRYMESMRRSMRRSSEGTTGWADTRMISTSDPHPNCMPEWMECTMEPKVQAEVGMVRRAGSNVDRASDRRTCR